ncbi:MAG: serine/threonine-protein kinase [Myxococcota bacterium]|nr:serine/threonine-protein kinase [Myxococcota bacterium]
MPLITPEERVGTTLDGRYRVEAVLGRGGMGAVLRGRHVHTGREVAIKLLLPEHARDAELLARFFQEARSAASLAHPNVVDTLDMDVEPESGQPYLVLELLDGQDLAARLEAQGPMTPGALLAVALPVMDALAAAHERGVVHRDLKPENLFLAHDARGRVVPKVLDFGIAKLLEGENAVHTVTGGVLGTPHFMSPEQAMGGPALGAQSDVWSMGAVMYVALTGQHPFEAETLPGLVTKVCTEDPTPIASLRPDVPAPIADAVHRALQRDLDARWPSMEAFGAGLVAAADAAGVTLAPGHRELFLGLAATRTGRIPSAQVALPRRRRRRSARRVWPWIAGGALLLPLVALALLAVPDDEAARAPPAARAPAATPVLPVGVDPPTPAASSQPRAEPLATTTPPAPRPPTEPLTDAPARALRLESEPPGAQVASGDQVLGHTPLRVALPGGAPRGLRVTAPGHEPLHVEIGPHSPDPLLVRLRPRRERVRRPRRRGEPLVPR